jgi:two-component system nitrate/nitrite response regulator NarL
MTRVFVIADIRLYRDGLVDVLGRGGQVEVVGASADLPAGLPMLETLMPDIALVGVSDGSAGATIEELGLVAPDTKTVVLAVEDSERTVVPLVEAGAAGYVGREASLEQLVETIDSVARGQGLCSPDVVGGLMRRLAAVSRRTRDDATSAALTRREREILALVDQGLSNKEIARDLCIEVTTVKNHVHNILEKLHVHRRGEAAALVRGTAPAAGRVPAMR